MKIAKNTTVSIEYTLKDDTGEILDSSKELGNLEYIQGYGMLIQGLEKALEGKEAGDEFKISVPPQEAYGEFRQDLIVETDRSNFPDDVELEIGMEFDAGHNRLVKITKIDGDKITVDANHPLAGETLHFEVKVVSVKETTEADFNALYGGGGCSCGCGGDDESGCGGCSGCC